MNFPVYIAKRYLKAKSARLTKIINVISAISITGVAIGSMALIIVLSVFNGFEELVISLYNSFDPDIKITAKTGKTFNPALIPMDSVRNMKEVKYLTEVLEENALLRYRDKQYIARIKGVDQNFGKITLLDSVIVEGKPSLQRGDTNYAVIGYGVAYSLAVDLNNMFNTLNVYVPKRDKKVSLNPEEAFNHSNIYVSGIFSIQQDFDSKYVLVPLGFARELLQYPTEVTAIEIGLQPGIDMESAQGKIQALLGPQYEVKDRFQQHELLYKIMKSEKWAVYLILTFILLIATFNVIGSLTMLIIDKQRDISTLWSLGASAKLIQQIFLVEGLFISLIGAILGLVAGFIICFLQQAFGIVKLQGSGTFVIDSYPVSMEIMDFIYVFLTVFVIGLIAAWYPSRKMLRQQFIKEFREF